MTCCAHALLLVSQRQGTNSDLNHIFLIRACSKADKSPTLTRLTSYYCPDGCACRERMREIIKMTLEQEVEPAVGRR